MAKGQFLQNPFLNALRREHVSVFVYLINGIKLQGQIESFDKFVLVLKNTVSQMIYKHAISTIVPSRPIISYKYKICSETNNYRYSKNIQDSSMSIRNKER